MPLTACRHIRKMRGGAQAHLIEADDGQFYVVKFVNNPQHRRILVNELIASVFLRYLQIAAPPYAIISITGDFLRDNPEVGLQLGRSTVFPTLGWHYGSRYPGDPAKLAVYDFLPDTLLRGVNNIADFRGVLAFDKWTANADGRQAVFFRARLKQWQPSHEAHPLKLGFITAMIDHGFVFNGPHWDFPESPIQGLYHRRLVYEGVSKLEDFEPWLDRVVHFPEETVDQAFRQVPPEWLDGDEDALESLLEKLLRRRNRVPDLIRQCRATSSDPFPNWRTR